MARHESSVYVGKNFLTVLANTGVGTTTPNVVSSKKEVETLVGTKKTKIETALWGSDNKLPHQITADVKRVTVLSSGLRKKIKIHFGQGLVVTQKDENGKSIEVTEGDAFEFVKTQRINRKIISHITDLEFFQLAFVEYILDNNGGAIVKLNMPSAPYLRVSVQEEDFDENEFKYFRSKWAVFSKQWAEDKVNEETSEAIHLVDPEWSAEFVKEWCKKNNVLKFIRPAMLYMPETDFYPEPYWNSARVSGWADIAILIPKVKNAIVKNSMTLKYIVKIPHNYFSKKYPTLSDKDLDAARQEDLDALNEFLSDYENTGGSITTYYDIDKQSGREIGAWQISVIENKIQDGVLNLDSAGANAEIAFALGINPTLIGGGLPGNTLGAKSGSDQRESFNIAVADAALDRVVSAEFLQFVSDFNGWDEANSYQFKNTILATTDKEPTGTQTKI